jgi:CBS domain containing-hemolysin-like protein
VLCALAALVAGMCSSADGALLALDPTGAPADRPGGATHDRERTHRALSMLRVLAHLTAGAAVAQGALLIARPMLERSLIAILFAVVIVALTEGAARSIGYFFGGTALRVLNPFIRLVRLVLAPATLLGATIERTLQRVLPSSSESDEAREASATQFHEVVAAEVEVSTAEEAILRGVFSLGDTEVREVMVPRVDIVGIDKGTPWSEVLERVRSSEHARFPVYEETLDNVLGILYAKDLLGAIIADREPDDGWASRVRPAAFIPTSKTIDAQLRDFKAGRTHIAIVSDEYGGTAGLVTIEDVLEEIVGEIRDEYDVEQPDLERDGDNRFWVSGRFPVEELRELVGQDFGVDDVTTVGGLTYALFGRVPRAGESLVRGNIRLVVERVRRRRIERVYLERVEARSNGRLS